MKTNLKKAIMPLAIVLFGAAAAFATNEMKQSNAPFVELPGYIYNQTQAECIPHVMCTTAPGPICRNAANLQVFGLNNSSNLTICTWQLYKIQ